MQMRHKLPHIYRCYEKIVESWKGVFEVERWQGEMVEWFPRNKFTKLYSVSSREVGPPLGWLTRDPVFLGTTSQPRRKHLQTMYCVIPGKLA
ncbi:MAG: hypothetical protein BWX75_00011 [Candidatus Cloacimonetes bacterium ADurb.Bin088]|nr:MAG: hypothetical protein BWX75_00011 [Candidatus Cloacimonetes bacterium ADurb.Bin088]